MKNLTELFATEKEARDFAAKQEAKSCYVAPRRKWAGPIVGWAVHKDTTWKGTK
jgi:hypothetical protein